MTGAEDFLRCGRSLAGAGPDVKGALLGQKPRYAPDRAFDTVHVALDLKVDFRRQALEGTCRTVLRAFRDGVREIVFDAVDLRIRQAVVDGKRARPVLTDGKLALRLPRPAAAGQKVEALLRYRVEKPRSGLHFVLPNRHAPGNPTQLWSQSQPEDARYWFPCQDNPQEKATSEVRLTVPKGFVAVSNGSLLETVEQGRLATYHWRMARPHSIYLISIAVGRFAVIEELWEGIPVTYYCERGRESDARRGFAKTVKAIAFFSAKTGVRYPYEKYAQVAVAEYPGGMEHTTCTTQTDAILLDRRAALDTDLDLLVAHELAHQWFGDLLTCRDWSHAWLNEGFATYFEILFQEHDKGRDEADYELWLNARSYFDEDQRRYRRPIVTTLYKEAWALFDRHTYEKGGWILHMLRAELGDALWWKAIAHYLRKFRDQSVETQDLVGALEESTGRNLRPFFDQWVYRTGYPDLRASYSWDDALRKGRLRILQAQEGGDTPLFNAPLTMRFVGRGWTREYRETISEKSHAFSYRLPSEPLNVEIDPDKVLLKKLALAKPQAMWLHQLRRAERAQARLEAAGHVARWGDARSVDALLQAALREPFWGAAAEMARAVAGVPGRSASASLLRLLRAPHPKVRRAAIEGLTRHPRPEAAPLLASLARRDPSLHVQAEAGRALGALRDRRWLPVLLGRLGTSAYRDLPAAGALSGLAASRAPQALALLKAASREPASFWRRAQAVRGLADFGATWPGAVAWIAGMTDGPDERLNMVAISALGQLEDERALPALERARTSASMRIRVSAEEAIARIRQGAEPRKPTTADRR